LEDCVNRITREREGICFKGIIFFNSVKRELLYSIGLKSVVVIDSDLELEELGNDKIQYLTINLIFTSNYVDTIDIQER
jgi:hypothetical protein